MPKRLITVEKRVASPDDPTDPELDIDSAIDVFLKSKWKEKVNKILIEETDPLPLEGYDYPLNRFR